MQVGHFQTKIIQRVGIMNELDVDESDDENIGSESD